VQDSRVRVSGPRVGRQQLLPQTRPRLANGGDPHAFGAGQEGQDLADAAFPATGFGERQVSPDLVTVGAAVLVLDDVPGFGEIGDDLMGGALGDARPGRDVAQLHARVVGDAQ
jgi:hypothetical protein